jgi:hypothetical protein
MYVKTTKITYGLRTSEDGEGTALNSGVDGTNNTSEHSRFDQERQIRSTTKIRRQRGGLTNLKKIPMKTRTGVDRRIHIQY